jgi:hypothetical protein
MYNTDALGTTLFERWYNAKLLEAAQIVGNRPVFHKLAASNAVDHHSRHGYALAVWWDAQIFPAKSALDRQAGDHFVSFSDLIFNRMDRIRKGSEEEDIGLFHPFPPRREIGNGWVMIDIVNGDQLIHNIQISLVHFYKPPTYKGFVCF